MKPAKQIGFSELVQKLKNGQLTRFIRQVGNTQALKKAGLPFTSTHILRHASLTEYYDTCKDLLATAVVAGHGDVRSTAKYAKARDERVVQIQKEMDKKLGGFEI